MADISTSRVRLGYVSFDDRARHNTSCTVFATAEQWDYFSRDRYVVVHDAGRDLEFLGRVVEGPFFAPQERRVDPGRVHATATKDADPPEFFIYGRVELIGRLTDGDRLVPTPTRPRPFSDVYLFPDDRLSRCLNLDGDFYLGMLEGHSDVRVFAESGDKNFLPRNVGIFGTVGSGKSNTAQVIVEEALDAGWAVVVIDVEGEYACMNEPTDDPVMVEMLRDRHHRVPRGIDDFHVYVPSSGKSEAVAPRPFKIPVSALDPEVVADILEFTEAEMRVFGNVTAQAARQHAPLPSETGAAQRPYNLQHLVDGLMEGPVVEGQPTIRLLPLSNVYDISTASKVRSKLVHLARSGMLDWNETSRIPELPIPDLLSAGRLSVLDVSETEDRSRNIAIAYVLQGLFNEVIATPRGEQMPNGKPRPPLLVVIEEVHTFVSRAAAPKMKAVLDTLQIITRRGRKRWMALALVSQQPNHVPDEIFELANTRFIHQVKSPSNLQPVKQTAGNIDESLWVSVPTLGQGQCVLAGAIFRNPLYVNVRPAHSRRLLVS